MSARREYLPVQYVVTLEPDFLELAHVLMGLVLALYWQALSTLAHFVH